jgi:iron(III) transport system ATP-binding protein
MNADSLHEIEVENLAISYGSVHVVGPISFNVVRGEQLTLLGPSGCGKTSTLRALAGLEKPNAGAIRIAGKSMFDADRGISLAAEQRGLSMVFQSYAIWPHMTVFENVAYGLRVRKTNAADLKQKVHYALDLVQMGAYAERNASQLSGGQQQRVAVARACAFGASVLLFDEPLSNLDAKLRAEMRIELRELQRRLNVTSVYVTHDLEEALAMSDQIIVMRAGHIEQQGSPSEIYNYPRTAFVADFVGSSNLISGRLRRDLSHGAVVAIEADGGNIVHGVSHGRTLSADAVMSVRTVHLQIADAAPTFSGLDHDNGSPKNVWPVTVTRSIFLGDMTQVHADWGGREVVIRQTAAGLWHVGQKAYLSVSPDHCVLLETG